jgi:hypothetical protein
MLTYPKKQENVTLWSFPFYTFMTMSKWKSNKLIVELAIVFIATTKEKEIIENPPQIDLLGKSCGGFLKLISDSSFGELLVIQRDLHERVQ